MKLAPVTLHSWFQVHRTMTLDGVVWGTDGFAALRMSAPPIDAVDGKPDGIAALLSRAPRRVADFQAIRGYRVDDHGIVFEGHRIALAEAAYSGLVWHIWHEPDSTADAVGKLGDEPVAAVMAFLLVGERLSVMQVGGMLLAATGVAIANRA